MLVSTRLRLGEPVVVACGPTRTGVGLQVGLLFIAPNLTSETLTLEGDGESVTVSIPSEYLNNPEPKWHTNVHLEASP